MGETEGKGGLGSRISAVLAFDCRLGARLGNVQHGSRGMGNGLAGTLMVWDAFEWMLV